MAQPPAVGSRERLEQFREYVKALNAQFQEWCSRQWETRPAKFWSSGMRDYLRHQAKIRLEFGDVIAEDENAPSSSNSSKDLSGRNGRPASPSPFAPAAKPYEPLLSLVPWCNTKVVHFIRHGEGFHNVGISTLDSHLKERGWDQAHTLGRHMHSQAPTNGVQLVVVSPLMRALETAAGVFGVDPTLCPQEAAEQLVLFMVAQSDDKDLRVGHGALVLRPGVKVLANELCRERLGPSQCDKRRPLGESREAFPGVDFSLIESDEDVLWREGMVEGESNVVVRGMKFLEWLMQRPETNIAVVTHSAFLWFTLTCFGYEYVKPVRDNLQRWYENCEMRTVVLSDGGGAGIPDRTWFRGGEAYNEPQKGLLASHPINAN
eukprot:scaffold9.g2998.t1